MVSQSDKSVRLAVWDSPLLTIRSSQWIKRCFDFVCALMGLLILFPLFLPIALVIRMTSPGPVFYCPLRVGKDGQPIRLYKFRTMRQDAERVGPGITRAGDDRITPVGHLLRQSKLDEFPQLLNVLMGEMSLVGPRPEDPRYVAHYTQDDRIVLAVRPGMTSLASIRYRNEEKLLQGDAWEDLYINQVMRDKLRVDRRYVEKWSLTLDLQILFYTFCVLPLTDETDLL